jgi:hypothetical protein
MKIATDTQDVALRGAQHVQSYQVEVSATLFDTLFQKLYSNPIPSIIREMYTNAMEVSPPSNPPRLKLPSHLEPTLVLRDFGPGMSRDFVLTTYTVGGASTKRLSNEFVGGFGFGAKSPYAYSDSFMITSWHKGTKTSYLMHRDSNRIPTVAEISSSPSSEPSGVEFRLTVKPADIAAFINAAASQLYAMPMLPIVSGASAFAFDKKPEFFWSTPEGIHGVKSGQKLYSYSNPRSPIYVCMGGPVYLLPDAATSQHNLNGGIWIDAPIGSVDLTPGREQLLFSPKTLAFLRSCEKKFIEDYLKHVDVSFTDVKTKWKALTIFQDLLDKADSLLVRSTLSHYKWNGELLHFGASFRFASALVDNPDPTSSTVSPKIKTSVQLYHTSNHYKSGLRIKEATYHSDKIGFDSEAEFLIVTSSDLKWKARVKDYLSADPTKTPKLTILYYSAEAEAAKLIDKDLKTLEDAPIKWLKDIPVVVKPKTPRPKHSVPAGTSYPTLRFNHHGSWWTKRHTRIEHTSPTPVAYLFSSKTKDGATTLQFKDGSPLINVADHSDDLQKLFSALYRVHPAPAAIANISTTAAVAFKKNIPAHWISLEDWLKNNRLPKIAMSPILEEYLQIKGDLVYHTPGLFIPIDSLGHKLDTLYAANKTTWSQDATAQQNPELVQVLSKFGITAPSPIVTPALAELKTIIDQLRAHPMWPLVLEYRQLCASYGKAAVSALLSFAQKV